MSYWEPLTPIDFVKKGRTRPFRVRCKRYNDETFGFDQGDWLAKAPRVGVIGPDEFFREVVGLRLARHFGINVPRVAIIEFDAEWIESLAGTRFAKPGFEVGIGVGCEFVHPIVTLSAGMPLERIGEAPARLLYAFDLLFANDDRSEGNPNCGLNKKELFAFDFERILTGPQQPAWQVWDYDFVPRHILHRTLQGTSGGWDPFLGRLMSLDAAFLRGQVDDLPLTWNTSARLNKLLRHVADAQSQPLKLKAQLDRALLRPAP